MAAVSALRIPWDRGRGKRTRRTHPSPEGGGRGGGCERLQAQGPALGKARGSGRAEASALRGGRRSRSLLVSQGPWRGHGDLCALRPARRPARTSFRLQRPCQAREPAEGTRGVAPDFSLRHPQTKVRSTLPQEGALQCPDCYYYNNYYIIIIFCLSVFLFGCRYLLTLHLSK